MKSLDGLISNLSNSTSEETHKWNIKDILRNTKTLVKSNSDFQSYIKHYKRKFIKPAFKSPHHQLYPQLRDPIEVSLNQSSLLSLNMMKLSCHVRDGSRNIPNIKAMFDGNKHNKTGSEYDALKLSKISLRKSSCVKSSINRFRKNSLKIRIDRNCSNNDLDIKLNHMDIFRDLDLSESRNFDVCSLNDQPDDDLYSYIYRKLDLMRFNDIENETNLVEYRNFRYFIRVESYRLCIEHNANTKIEIPIPFDLAFVISLLTSLELKILLSQIIRQTPTEPNPIGIDLKAVKCLVEYFSLHGRQIISTAKRTSIDYLTDSKIYTIAIYPPRLTLEYNENLFIKRLDDVLLIRLLRRNFLEWNSLMIQYLTTFKLFRTEFRLCNSIHKLKLNKIAQRQCIILDSNQPDNLTNRQLDTFEFIISERMANSLESVNKLFSLHSYKVLIERPNCDKITRESSLRDFYRIYKLKDKIDLNVLFKRLTIRNRKETKSSSIVDNRVNFDLLAQLDLSSITARESISSVLNDIEVDYVPPYFRTWVLNPVLGVIEEQFQIEASDTLLDRLSLRDINEWSSVIQEVRMENPLLRFLPNVLKNKKFKFCIHNILKRITQSKKINSP